MIDDVKKVLHDFRYRVFLTSLQVSCAVLLYAAVSKYFHVTDERALSEPHSLPGPQMPMRCYFTRQYRIPPAVPVRDHLHKHSLSLAKGYARGNTLYFSMDIPS